MKHDILVNAKEKTITFTNLLADSTKIEFIRMSDNWCIYQSTIPKNLYSQSFVEKNGDYRLYIRETSQYEIDITIYDISIIDDGFKIIKHEPSKNFDFNREITLITGSAGGGTSIVTRFFKFLGAHAGDDSGDVKVRKTHEAYGFKLWVRGLDENIPNDYHKKNFYKVADTYNYKEGKVNIIKIPESETKLNMLGDIFPNLKLITIVREQNNFFGTNEGKRFYSMDNFELFKKQYPIVEGLPVFNLDFYKFFTDYHYTNKVLKFLKLDCTITNQSQFEFIKEKINFDKRVLEIKN